MKTQAKTGINSEKIISSFKSNQEKFEIVKRYLVLKDNDFSISKSNVDEITDENVKNSAKYIFNELSFELIKKCQSENDNNYTIIFDISNHKNRTTRQIIFDEKSRSGYNFTELIVGNWYYFEVGLT